MKALIFSYGSLILPENLEKFNSKILKSVFLKGFYISSIKSPITKTNYHYIQLNKTPWWVNSDNDIVPGFLIETEDIEAIDKWEGNSYIRKEVTCFTRNLEKIKCFAYFSNK